MNNELFDRMMKDALNNVQAEPSAGLQKTLGKKLFFQNLMVFHKFKMIAAALFVGGVSAVAIHEYSADPDKAAVYVSQESTDVQLIPKVNAYSEDLSASNEKGSTLSNNNSSETNSNSNTPLSNDENSSNSNNADLSYNNNENKNKANNSSNSGDFGSPEKNPSKVNPKNGSNTSADGSMDEPVSYPSTDKSVDLELAVEDVQLFKGTPNGIDLSNELISSPVNVGNAEYVKPRKPIFKEVSFDVWGGFKGTSDIDNEILSSVYNKYYWDFYQESEALSAAQQGGVNVNYSIGTSLYKVKFSTGVNHSLYHDTKAVYEFHEVTDPQWLSFFKEDELSWVNTMGEDTCVQCFYAHNSEELQDELEQDYNRYTYISVPFKLGGELNFKVVSLDVMAGLQWNHLTQAKGLYVSDTEPVNERLYYWSDKQLTTLSRNNEMLKTNYLSWTLNTNVRFRVARQFDLFAGYQMGASFGDITKDAYMINKKMKSSQARVGITFHPFRLPLKNKM